MKADPILQEVWDIKDRLAAEAGYDMERFVRQLREWTATHPPAGPIVRNAAELRHLLEARERELAGNLALRDEPPKPAN